jgi:hypothetical protein
MQDKEKLLMPCEQAYQRQRTNWGQACLPVGRQFPRAWAIPRTFLDGLPEQCVDVLPGPEPRDHG